MKKIKVPENNFVPAKIIAEILEIYSDEGIPEPEMHAAITAAITTGHEGPLARHTVWTELPTKARVAFAQWVSHIVDLAWKWRFDQDEDLLFPQRLIKAQNTDNIRPTIETTRYLIKLLSERKIVTISKPTDFEPHIVIIHTSGYPDKTVLFASLCLASIAMGIEIGSETSSKPDELLLYR